MRVCLISQGSLRDFKNQTGFCESAKVFLFGFNGIREVSYEKELKEETAYFSDAALLSKREKGVVISGCVTDTRGLKRKSAVIAENGKILGVSDMLNVMDGEFNSGGGLRIYETHAGRIGIAVAEDLHYPEVIRSLAVCGCDYIVCPFGRITDSLQSVLMRAYGYCYGIPILLCGQGYAIIADGKGNVPFASPQSPVFADFECVNEYHLIQTRRRMHRVYT